MKKTLLLITVVICFINQVQAQKWYPLATSNGNITGFCEYRGDLYAAGIFTILGGAISTNIARWDGTKWNSIDGGLKMRAGDGNGWAIDMAVYKDELYVTGNFDYAGTVQAGSIVKWNGTSWSNLDSVPDYGQQMALAVYKDYLYIGGNNIRVPNSTATSSINIARFNGTVLSDIGGTKGNDYNISGIVEDLVVFKNKLYVGGHFIKAGNISADNIACWNDTVWTEPSSGLGDHVWKLAADSNFLYATGEFYYDGSYYIAKYSGSGWIGLGSGICNQYNNVLLSHKNALYTDGGCLYASLQKYSNGDWVKADTTDALKTGNANSMCVYKNVMFVGGASFTSNGVRYGIYTSVDLSTPPPTTTTGTITGIKEQKTADFRVYPNPSNGSFNIDLPSDEDAKIQISSIDGRIVWEEKLAKGNRSIHSKLSKGFYLLRVNEKTVTKIAIE